MDTQPPIDYYGQAIPRFQRRSWDGSADWTFLFREGRGNDTRFKNHNHTYKHPIIIALALRKQGKGIKQIGKHLGCNHGHVSTMIKPFGLDVDVKAATNPQLDRLGMWAGYVEAEIATHKRLERGHGKWWREAYTKRLTPMERYYANHGESKKRAADYANRRYHAFKHDPLHKITRTLRAAMYRITRVYKGIKKQRTMAYVGCTHEQARRHLESMFKPGMTWGTHGTHWEIDHIRPMSSYDFTRQEDIQACCHFTNLQPLWKHENRSKSDKWEIAQV